MKKIKNLFLRNSYQDAKNNYNKVLNNKVKSWDIIVLTASNEMQANTYKLQIEKRINENLLPKHIKFIVIPDLDGKRIGSGGATLNVLHELNKEFDLKDKKVLIIHSGGDSRRVPQYSCFGKLFSPIPRELEYHKASTLFDELITITSDLPNRMNSGIFVMCGDALVLFNPLQIDLQYKEACAISMKMPIDFGTRHGVFLNDNDDVLNFLHKQPLEVLEKNFNDYLDIDTGMIYLSYNIIKDLLALIKNKEDFNLFISNETCLNFYGDFLYPLAKNSTLENYLHEKGEKSNSKTLNTCRKKLWDTLSKFELKIEKLSPSLFLHFGTTNELLNIMTKDIESYFYLDWQKHSSSFIDNKNEYFTTINSIIKNSNINKNCYIENSIVKDSTIGKNIILSNTEIVNQTIPDNTVISSIQLNNGKYVSRIYDIYTNPKELITSETKLFNHSISKIINNDNYTIWNCSLYPISDTLKDSIENSLIFYKVVTKTANDEEINKYNSFEKISFEESFNNANTKKMINDLSNLEEEIVKEKIMNILETKKDLFEAYNLYLSFNNQNNILQELKSLKYDDNLIEMRKFYLLGLIDKENYDDYMIKSFAEIKEVVNNDDNDYGKEIYDNDFIEVESPVRINFGGGWSDTPPYCIENGGCVLNVAIKLNDIYPIYVSIEKLKDKELIFSCVDFNNTTKINTIEELRNCNNPNDSYALVKCAMIISNIVKKSDKNLDELFSRINGGLKITTNTKMIPRGSGLGTSSILAGTVLKALYKYMGLNVSDENICNDVLKLEQLMSTGGGWQDQVGGLIKGLKLISTNPGEKQKLEIKNINLSKNTINELNERLLLINTSQRRLARNLLRDIMGKYIAGNKEIINILSEIQIIAKKMTTTFEDDNIDEFAKLLNEHWELSKKLDKGCTNTCIDFIFESLKDLIDGRFICGAGGGGFLVILLKKGIKKEDIDKRITEVFQDTGVCSYSITID